MRIDLGVGDLAKDLQLRVAIACGDCKWWDVGLCYWVGLNGNFVADCREQTAASSVASELLLALLVNCFLRCG